MSDYFKKNIKAGWQNKYDPMRAKAQKLMGKAGNVADVTYSDTCADKMKMRRGAPSA